MLAELGKFTEEMIKAGRIVATGAASPQGTRVKLNGSKFTATDGPFIELKELTGGFAILNADWMEEAVELAKAIGRPVKVIWSREDDVKHGFYHSIAANYCKAELTEKNAADYWLQRVVHPPIGWTFDAKSDVPGDGLLAQSFADIPFALAGSMACWALGTHHGPEESSRLPHELPTPALLSTRDS